MTYCTSPTRHWIYQLPRILRGGGAALLLLLLASPLTAGPVWSGNASVDASEFVNFVEDTPLAGASSSFTRNTVVEVTNPQNGRTIEVTIVKRAPRPGVFLVLSAAAGEALDFPADQVIPVQVRMVEETASSGYDSRFESTDPDINPAVNLPEEGTAALVPPDTEIPEEAEELPEAVLTEEESGAEPSLLTEGPEETDSFLDEPLPVPLPAEPEEFLTLTEEVFPEETLPAADLPVEVPAELPEEETALAVAPEDPLPEEAIPDTAEGDNIIYFLTPSDFRPPEAPVSSPEEEIVPVYVERDVLENNIADQLRKGASYIQLGAYSSAALVYSEMESIASRYPMIVWTEDGERGQVFKLLIGPLTPDETGVLVYRFRSKGYADLFLYRP